MAVKLKKLPKKPKTNASIATKEAYLRKVAEIKKENAKIIADKKKSKELDRRIDAAVKGCK